MENQRVNIPFFDLKRTLEPLREELHKELDRVLDSGMFIAGDSVQRFEVEFAQYIGVSDCVLVGNGLDALRLSLEILGVGPGDEVIVPGFTFIATWLAVIQSGAIPVPVDVSLQDANLDVSKLEKAITNRTKAIIPVHLFGSPADLKSIATIADAHKLFVIDDAAQCHGAVVDGVRVGSISTVGAFSFYPTKNLGALGDAGCITTSDSELAKKMRSMRSYGQGVSKYDHIRLGYNSRTDALQAAFLSLFLRNLDDWNSRRQEIARAYRSSLGEKVSASLGPKNVSDSVWHHFVVRTNDRKRFISYMEEKGISTDIHYPYAPHQLKAMSENLPSESLRNNDLANSIKLAASVVSLPIGPWMTDAEIDQVCRALSEAPRNLL